MTHADRSTLDDEAFWEIASQAIETGLKLKKIMQRKRIRACRCECPRCGKIIHASLVGRKDHLRMACEGQCGMNLLE